MIEKFFEDYDSFEGDLSPIYFEDYGYEENEILGGYHKKESSICITFLLKFNIIDEKHVELMMHSPDIIISRLSTRVAIVEKDILNNFDKLREILVGFIEDRLKEVNDYD